MSIITTDAGYFEVDRAHDEPFDLSVAPTVLGYSVLLRGQADATTRGAYVAVVGEGGALEWAQVRWTAEVVQVFACNLQFPSHAENGDPLARLNGCSCNGLYLLPPASGITWGETEITITKIGAGG